MAKTLVELVDSGVGAHSEECVVLRFSQQDLATLTGASLQERPMPADLLTDAASLVPVLALAAATVHDNRFIRSLIESGLDCNNFVCCLAVRHSSTAMKEGTRTPEKHESARQRPAW